MNKLFSVAGISKQSFHQYHNRLVLKQQEEAYLEMMIQKIRQDHPTMNCRDMYYKIKPTTIGRDAFEEFCRLEGYQINRVKNFRHTTDSRGVKRFFNLTINLQVTRINQLWVSDITYFEVNQRFYFITFVMDVHTRRILGYSVSSRLLAEDTSLAALKMALRTRKAKQIPGLIFHSDGGGQYYDNTFLKLTKDASISNSMCRYPWENPYAERLNGIIKNNYLIHWNINTYETLLKEVDRAVKLYNYDKPHKSLNKLTPFEYENLYI